MGIMPHTESKFRNIFNVIALDCHMCVCKCGHIVDSLLTPSGGTVNVPTMQ